MITTVLLDLDDTILDFHKAEKEALKKALQKVGVEPTEKLLARYSAVSYTHLVPGKRSDRRGVKP